MIKGLDELSRKMKELEKAISALDGEIGSVSFNPQDPQSIELAIQKMETAIDERVGDYRNNDMVEGIIGETKERYREAILERAAAARNEEGEEA
jgi:tRNA threonylcarbamoyladenosine modification (KEOPS) complex Cgi121 subunit